MNSLKRTKYSWSLGIIRKKNSQITTKSLPRKKKDKKNHHENTSEVLRVLQIKVDKLSKNEKTNNRDNWKIMQKPYYFTTKEQIFTNIEQL